MIGHRYFIAVDIVVNAIDLEIISEGGGGSTDEGEDEQYCS